MAKYRIEISVEVDAESFQHATDQSRWLARQLDYRAEVRGTWLVEDNGGDLPYKEGRNEIES